MKVICTLDYIDGSRSKTSKVVELEDIDTSFLKPSAGTWKQPDARRSSLSR